MNWHMQIWEAVWPEPYHTLRLARNVPGKRSVISVISVIGVLEGHCTGDFLVHVPIYGGRKHQVWEIQRKKRKKRINCWHMENGSVTHSGFVRVIDYPCSRWAWQDEFGLWFWFAGIKSNLLDSYNCQLYMNPTKLRNSKISTRILCHFLDVEAGASLPRHPSIICLYKRFRLLNKALSPWKTQFAVLISMCWKLETKNGFLELKVTVGRCVQLNPNAVRK